MFLLLRRKQFSSFPTRHLDGSGFKWIILNFDPKLKQCNKKDVLLFSWMVVNCERVYLQMTVLWVTEEGNNSSKFSGFHGGR
jgi:hypothetical protein